MKMNLGLFIAIGLIASVEQPFARDASPILSSLMPVEQGVESRLASFTFATPMLELKAGSTTFGSKASLAFHSNFTGVSNANNQWDTPLTDRDSGARYILGGISGHYDSMRHVSVIERGVDDCLAGLADRCNQRTTALTDSAVFVSSTRGSASGYGGFVNDMSVLTRDVVDLNLGGFWNGRSTTFATWVAGSARGSASGHNGGFLKHVSTANLGAGWLDDIHSDRYGRAPSSTHATVRINGEVGCVTDNGFINGSQCIKLPETNPEWFAQLGDSADFVFPQPKLGKNHSTNLLLDSVRSIEASLRHLGQLL